MADKAKALKQGAGAASAEAEDKSTEPTASTEQAEQGRQDGRAQRRADAQARRKERDAKGKSFDAARPKQFEFSAEHDPKFARLGTLMTVAGLFDLVIAVSSLVGLYFLAMTIPTTSLVQVFALVPPVAVAAVGMWTMRAGRCFSLVASTQHSDVTLLMGAVDELTKLFLLQVVAAVVGIGSAVLSVVLAMAHGPQ